MRKKIFRRQGLSRRRVLLTGTAFGGLVAGLPGIARGQAPGFVPSDRMRPQALQGLMSGDVTASQAVIWSRAGRPARMFVEYAASEKFADARPARGSQATQPTDFTTRVVLPDPPARQGNSSPGPHLGVPALTPRHP